MKGSSEFSTKLKKEQGKDNKGTTVKE